MFKADKPKKTLRRFGEAGKDCLSLMMPIR
jgi:hypothetical protein